MGYAYLSKGKKQGYKILIDEAMDISAVPGEKFFPGTEAVTADGATRYRLNNAHEWVLMYSSPVPVAAGPFLAVERLGPYVYSVSFDALPEDTGDLFITPMGCSSFVQDGKLYRNLDWNYAETAEFLVRTKNYTGMAFIDGLNDGELDAKKIAQLPYRVCDGVNNDGIMVSTHVLFNDWDYAGSGDKTVPLTKIPHLILENVHSMAELETKLSQYLANIRQPEGDYILQFLVTDGETTSVILPPESDSGAYEIVDATDNPKLANFRWLADANVSLETEGLQDRPTGIERWNLMPCDLEDLRFTLAYEDDDRLSEFIGINGTTKESTEEELLEIYELASAAYISRTRNGETWQTMHSVIYSANGLESLHTQENWSVDYAGGGKSEVSGLPEVSGSGKALVSVNGEWVEQDGYGYSEGGEQSVITWDGNTEGLEPVSGIAYKVSDLTPTREMLSGATIEFTSTVTHEKSTISVSSIAEPMTGLLVVDSSVYIAVTDIAEAEMQKGTYFVKRGEPDNAYVSSLAYGTPATVHKIDSKYLPEVGGGGVFTVNLTGNVTIETDLTITCEDLVSDKTLLEIAAAVQSGSYVVCRLAYESNTFIAPLVQSLIGDNTKQFTFVATGYGSQMEAVCSLSVVIGDDGISAYGKIIIA